jgi:hypothetical protein
MKTKKLLVVSLFLAVAAFGLYGLNALINSPIPPAQAAAPAESQPVSFTLATPAPGAPEMVTTTIEIQPAAELPARAPDAGGIYGGRDGSTLTLDSFRVEADGAQGVAIAAGGSTGKVPDGAPQGSVIVTTQEKGLNSAGEGETGKPQTGLSQVIIQGSHTEGHGVLSFSTRLPDAAGETSPSTFSFTPGTPMQPTQQKVAVTDATKIYKDTTPSIDPSKGGMHTLQQTVAAGSLDDLNEHSMVTVWGHQDGDQLIADVIFYQEPMLLK